MMELADVARLSGHPDEAVRVLAKIPGRFPDNRSAGIASFTRGRIEIDQLKHPIEAAAAFDEAIRLGLPSALFEDACVRLVESRHSAGDAKGAAAALDQYVAHFPQGKERDRLQQLLAKP
jgi:transmembrane sensor